VDAQRTARPQIELARGRPHHRQVHFAARKQVRERLPVTDLELQIEPGMLAQKTGQQARHEVFRSRQHADDKPAGLHASEPRDRIFGVLQVGQQASRVHKEILARRGERNPPARALEQWHFQRRFEPGDLHRDGRRRQVQLLRCPGEAHMAGYRREHLELAERQAKHKFYLNLVLTNFYFTLIPDTLTVQGECPGRTLRLVVSPPEFTQSARQALCIRR
jgi:hypothetical protein